jgi:hypothetical protein
MQTHSLALRGRGKILFKVKIGAQLSMKPIELIKRIATCLQTMRGMAMRAIGGRKEVSPGKDGSDVLAQYLDYYSRLEAPGFAVLVTGEWGSGKTFQVLKLVPEKRRYYVSLFGLTSKEEIYSELLAQIYPSDAKAKKEADFFSKLNPFDLSIGVVMASAIRRKLRTKLNKDRIIIFDDVERSPIPLKIRLGIINDLVEHEKCHVVVIAHDEQIAKEFSESKEKVFGHTVSIIPRTIQAFDAFVADLGQKTQKVVTDHRALLLEVFSISSCKSLRVLKQALAGIERFCEILSHEQIANVEVLKRLLALHYSISIEVLRGDLSRKDLAERAESFGLAKAMRQRSKANNGASEQQELPSAFDTSYERYLPVLKISDFDLSNELLIHMIVDGQYDKTELQAYLAERQSFEQPKKWPAWRRFMGFDSLTDDVVAQAAIEMDSQFENRDVTDFGEWMQIVSLRIMRIKEGLMKGAQEDIVIDCMQYLDDLVAQKRFPLKPNIGVFGSHPAHGGVMLWGYEENKEVLNKIRDHIFKCEKLALQMYSPEIKQQLLSAIENSPDELGGLLNYSDGKSAAYQTVPALLSLPPSEFVDVFLKLPVDKWETTQRVLSKRWNMVSATNSLAEEAKWFEELEAEMLKRAEAQANTINALRIKRHVPRKY